MSLRDSIATVVDAAPIMAAWVGSGGHVVDQDIAQARADKCLVCPKRIPTPNVLGFAADSMKKILELKSRLKLRVVGEKAVGNCGVCNCVNRLRVWMPLEKVKIELTAAELGLLHGECWITNEA